MLSFENVRELLKCAIKYKNTKLAFIACDVLESLSLQSTVKHETALRYTVAIHFVNLSPTQENVRTLLSILDNDDHFIERYNDNATPVDPISHDDDAHGTTESVGEVGMCVLPNAS